MRRLDPGKVVEDVGRRVAELRVERRLTQETLAETLGTSTKYIQRVEAGRSNLTIKSLVKLANALKVEATDLFTAPRTRKPKPGRPRTTAP